MGRSTQIRPKFRVYTDLSPDIVVDEFQLLLNTSKKVEGRIIDNNLYLKLPEDELHYWSPELQVKIKKEEKATSIRGIVGPNSKVWATFMVFYGLAIMLLIFGGSFGISQWMLDIDSIWIWSVPASVLLYAIIFLAAKYGQRLGADQSIQLRNFLDEAIENAENKH